MAEIRGMTEMELNQKELEALIRQIGFYGLSQSANDKIVAAAKGRFYPKGTVIFAEGELSRDYYLVLAGRVKLVLQNDGGREITLRRRGPGAAFGSFSALDSLPREASMVAITNCRMAVLSGDDYLNVLKTEPDVTFDLAACLVREIRALYKRVHAFNQYPVRQRLALEILRQANWHLAQGKRLEDAHFPTQVELAGLIDTTREAVSREMHSFYECGALMKSGRDTHFGDLTRLAEIGCPVSPSDGKGFIQYFPYEYGPFVNLTG
jgi:CRP-like cAMP-binding protein